MFPFPPVSPPVLSVPAGAQVVSVREGANAELVCLVVDGKPRPPVLWSRVEKDLLMPGGKTMVETPDGRLRLRNVSRDMTGIYRCQTAPYNGLNIKRREAQVQVNVQCECYASGSSWTSFCATTLNIYHTQDRCSGHTRSTNFHLCNLLNLDLIQSAASAYYCCCVYSEHQTGIHETLMIHWQKGSSEHQQ